MAGKSAWVHWEPGRGEERAGVNVGGGRGGQDSPRGKGAGKPSSTPPGGAVTDSCRWTTRTTEMYFVTILEAGSPKPRRQFLLGLPAGFAEGRLLSESSHGRSSACACVLISFSYNDTGQVG